MSQPLSFGDEIDASARRPVKLLLAGAGFWLVIGAALTLFGSIEFHIPNFSSSVWTYGKVQAAQNSALLYGFGLQSIFALSLWMLCRLSGNPLAGAGMASIATFFWNLALTIGVAGILLGDSTGFEAFELPRYATPILLAAHLVIVFCVLKTFRRRSVNARAYGVSEWFLIAALLWFGWIFLNANIFLLMTPARGVVQACIQGWYAESLRNVVFGFAGLASAFYFIPKRLRHPPAQPSIGALCPVDFGALWQLREPPGRSAFSGLDYQPEHGVNNSSSIAGPGCCV